MHDQAEKLRALAKNLKEQFESEIMNVPKKTRIIAVTSGKGGVGKTNFTINLALALMSFGVKVMVLDADMGLANVDVILGINPTYNLYHVLKGEKNFTEILTTGPRGLQILAGGSGIQELANLRRWQVEQFIDKLDQLEGLADVLFIDTGAGLSATVMGFVLAADEVILITTPEPTAITDAYGLVKAMTSKKKNGRVHLVVNRVENEQEAEEASNKLTTVAERFLKLHIGSLGFIIDDPVVPRSVKNQEPFLLKYPKSQASNCINRVAAKLINREFNGTDPAGIRAFFKRIVNVFQ